MANHNIPYNIYKFFLQDLYNIGIKNMADYRECLEAEKYFNNWLELSNIENNLLMKLGGLVKSIPHFLSNSDSNIQLFIDLPNSFMNKSQRNKSLIFSDKTFLLTKEMEDTDHGEEDDLYEPELSYVKHYDIQDLVSCIFNHLPECRDGIFFPFPKEFNSIDIELYNKIYEDTGNRLSYIETYTPEEIMEEAEFNANKEASHSWEVSPNVFFLSNNGPAIGINHQALKAGFLLPSIEKSSPSVIRKLRKEYSEIFSRFQKALVKLSDDSNHIDDEKRLVEIFQKIDHEIERLNKEFESIKKIHKNIRIVMGMICISLFLTSKIDTNYQNFIYSIMSGAGLKFVDFFFDSRDIKSKIESDPFYFAFKINKELMSI